MKHQLTEDRGKQIVALSGEIDLENSPKVRKVLLEVVDRGKPVLVELSAVPYMDSSGIASLVEAYQKAKKKGVEFALVNVNPAVLRVLNLARLDKVFTFYENVESVFNAES
ncbi:MAG: STAS domain-containing protein [Nitrospirae bacterium]|nr:STAS domain-containing protein [Nitrospirota bacterium]